MLTSVEETRCFSGLTGVTLSRAAVPYGYCKGTFWRGVLTNFTCVYAAYESMMKI